MADVRILLISGTDRGGRSREAAGPDGIITDPEIRTGLGAALAALAEHARG